MNEGIVEKILGAILLFLLIGVIIIGFNEDTEYIYKCTDYAGNVVYCTHAYTNKGGMFGYMKDGTQITITSYKRVLKSEVKDE